MTSARACIFRPLLILLPALVIAAAPLSALAEKGDEDVTIIFFHQEDDGVYTFTNKRTSDKFKPYMVFRDVIRRGNVSIRKIVRFAHKYSRKYNLDMKLVQAVIEVESGYESDAVSSAGAEGLMQIMPETQKDLGVTEPFDAEQNIEGGVRYLRSMLDRFGTVELALAAYNAGPGNVEKYNGIPPFKETRDYVRKVMALYGRK